MCLLPEVKEEVYAILSFGNNYYRSLHMNIYSWPNYSVYQTGCWPGDLKCMEWFAIKYQCVM